MTIYSNQDPEECIPPVDSHWTWLKTKADLEILRTAALEYRQLAVDLEADSMYRYHTRICLIQISTPIQTWICDPFDFEFISELTEIFSSVELLMHGCDYDLRLMKTFWNYTPQKLWDSHLAGRFLGHTQLGLGAFVQEYCGISLDKKFQKADWTKRPLSAEMLNYAALDTQYLFTLYEKMNTLLHEVKRYDWCVEYTQKFLEQNSISFEFDKNEAWRIKNSNKLTRQALAFLKEIWTWREELAEHFDCPPFKVMSNEVLLFAAQKLCYQNDLLGALGGVNRLSRRITTEMIQKLQVNVNEVYAIDPLSYPKKSRERGVILKGDATTRFEKIKIRRDLIAEKYKLDPSLIISKHVMVEWAETPTLKNSLLQHWQRQIFDEFDAN